MLAVVRFHLAPLLAAPAERTTADPGSSRTVHPGRHRQGRPALQRPVHSVPRQGRRPGVGRRPPPRSVPPLAVRRGPRAGDHARHAGRDAAVHAAAARAHRHRRLHSRRVRHDAPRSESGTRRAGGASSTARGSAPRATAWPARARARAGSERHRHRARAGGARALDSRSVLGACCRSTGRCES